MLPSLRDRTDCDDAVCGASACLDLSGNLPNNAAGSVTAAFGRRIKAGDLVIAYENSTSLKSVYVDPKKEFNTRFGNFSQKGWVGIPYGSKVLSKPLTGQRRGWVHLLAPTPELWTLVLKHRTQILYIADISTVVFQLELRPGSVVLESGTGSGSLTHSLVRAVAPTGHVHTFEFHPQRAEEAAKEFAQHGLASCVTVKQRNIEELGFPEELAGLCDGVFLDLPGPHKVVPSAARCLRPDGRFCSFSPCIEQVQRTAEALALNNFVDVKTIEVILHELEVQNERLITDLAIVRPAKKPRAMPTDGALNPAVVAAAQDAAPVSSVVECCTSIGDTADPDGSSAAKTANAVTADNATAQEASASTAAVEDLEQRGAPAAGVVPGCRAGIRPGQPTACIALSQPRYSTVATSRPAMEARGHTGYLTFARKFVCAP